jgi:hypothetical protein
MLIWPRSRCLQGLEGAGGRRFSPHFHDRARLRSRRLPAIDAARSISATMPRRPTPLVLTLIGASALAAVVLALVATGTIRSTCGYGSGRNSNACKPRPPATAAQISAAVDGSALEHGLEALRRSPDGGREVVGVGVNRWGEVSFAFATGKTGFGAEAQRFVRFDPHGRPLEYRGQSQYEDAFGTIAFKPELASPAALRDVLARVDRVERFSGARFNPGFGDRGLAWTLTFVDRDTPDDPQPASYVMAADGTGLCRMNPGPPPSPVPDCDLWRLPTSAAATGQTLPVDPGKRGEVPMPPPDPAAKHAMDQLACVQRARGDVQAMQRCVPAP